MCSASLLPGERAGPVSERRGSTLSSSGRGRCCCLLVKAPGASERREAQPPVELRARAIQARARRGFHLRKRAVSARWPAPLGCGQRRRGGQQQHDSRRLPASLAPRPRHEGDQQEPACPPEEPQGPMPAQGPCPPTSPRSKSWQAARLRPLRAATQPGAPPLRPSQVVRGTARDMHGAGRAPLVTFAAALWRRAASASLGTATVVNVVLLPARLTHGSQTLAATSTRREHRDPGRTLQLGALWARWTDTALVAWG